MINIDNYFMLPEDICKTVAKNIIRHRKARKISQKEMAERSGVSYSSIRRFETKGEISFLSLVRIAQVLSLEEEIENLFSKKYYASIKEVIDEQL